jgi:hypothetical protein
MVMFLLTTNKSKRLIHMSFIGHVTAEELRQGSRDLVALLPDLPAGLHLLADLERLESMDADCVEQLGKNMELLDRHGVELAVRVIPDPTKDIGLSILTVFHYRNPPRTVICETMAEAARALSL